jgi:GntR family transcriptional regulator/MocR family aminotransferase
MRFAIGLDQNSGIPLHRQLYEEWRKGILTGRFRRAERVPSTRELAATLAVARSTVTAAYDQLAAEGYLESAPGSGTFVCRELPDELLRPKPRPVTRAAEEAPVRLSRYGAGLEENFRYPAVPPGVIAFWQWRPDLGRFPFALWRKLLARHLREARPELFDYTNSAAGYAPLRSQIAAYVARSRAVRCTAEQIIVVNGSQQGLDLCARLLLEAGDEVAFENPGYQGARRTFEALGARLQPVRIDGDGLVAEEIGAGARLVYVTPSHQFPVGVSMSVARRLELIEWARRAGAVIVEDDYDSEYRYNGPPLPSMQGLARGTPVVYIGTFSKVMFPGLRIGYVVAPGKLVAAFTRAKWLADRNTPMLEQAALADFLREGHLERHIRRMRRLYGQRREVLVDSLARHFGPRAAVLGDPAGMHVLVRFADDSIAERAARNKVQITNAGAYYLGKAPRGEFVLGFSAMGERSIREGVRRLA